MALGDEASSLGVLTYTQIPLHTHGGHKHVKCLEDVSRGEARYKIQKQDHMVRTVNPATKDKQSETFTSTICRVMLLGGCKKKLSVWGALIKSTKIDHEAYTVHN